MNENIKIEVVVDDAGDADRILRWAQIAEIVDSLTIRVESRASGSHTEQNGALNDAAEWLSRTFSYSDSLSPEEDAGARRYTVIKGL
jgi:hypothetical protein